MYFFRSVFFLLLFTGNLVVFGQGITGSVKDVNGKALPHASIFIPEHSISSISNDEGQYSIKLPAGKATVHVSYLGYTSSQFQIEIANDWVERDFILRGQHILLNEVTVRNNDEDFAYTIIGKAIAKKKFHLLQYNSFEMTAYMKGSAQLKGVPFYLKKKFKEKGFDEAYALESVSKFKFQQPDKIDQKVISIHTRGQESPRIQPSLFLNKSFYKDRINGSVSPLSKSAFKYYKFKYEGSFSDNDRLIYKIKVTPRSNGDHVFIGYIYIIDEHWAIHSLDLTTRVAGFPIEVQQQYAEVAKHVWLPVTQKIHFLFDLLGYSIEYGFLRSSSGYKVELNKDLASGKEIIDESRDEVSGNATKDPGIERPLADLLKNKAPVTRKQYVKLLQQYEKNSRREDKESKKILAEVTFSVDSLAHRRDSVYWDSIRPVPLTLKEKRGYQRRDSIAQEQPASRKDSVVVKVRQEFSPFAIITGGSFNLSDRTIFTLEPPLYNLNFNTVEGLNVDLVGKLSHKGGPTGRDFEFEPILRYGFSSEQFYGRGKFTYGNQGDHGGSRVYFEGGSFIEQFNRDRGISQGLNSFNTLVLRRNFIKIFEKQYLRSGYEYSRSVFFKIGGNLEWSRRTELRNTTDYSFFFRKSRTFASNAPQSNELSDTSFPSHQALILSADISYRPFQRYHITNGEKVPHAELSPELKVSYVKGIKNAFNSNVDFDRVELSANYSMPAGAGSKFHAELTGGTFLNSRRTFFMDYQHFSTNLSPLAAAKTTGTYRLLDYYSYSTSKSWLSAFAHHNFRELLLTRIPGFRLSGLKESMFVNYLKTTTSPQYYELGYSLDNLFKILRIETVFSFSDGNYREFGIRARVKKDLGTFRK